MCHYIFILSNDLLGYEAYKLSQMIITSFKNMSHVIT